MLHLQKQMKMGEQALAGRVLMENVGVSKEGGLQHGSQAVRDGEAMARLGSSLAW